MRAMRATRATSRNIGRWAAALAVALTAGCADDTTGGGAQGATDAAAGDTADGSPPGDDGLLGDGGAGVDAAGDGGGDAGVDAAPPGDGQGDASLPDAGPEDAGPTDTAGGADDASTSPDTGGDTGGPGDAATDGGDTATFPPEGALDHEVWGGRVWGPVMGMSIIGRDLWFGTMGTYELPSEQDQQTTMRGGIGRLDLDGGALRLFEEELPSFTYAEDPAGAPVEIGPMPTGASVGDGDRVLVVAYTGVIAIEGEALTFHELLPGDGLPMEVRSLAVDRGGDRSRLWVGTNHGLYLLDPDTFETQALFGTAELGNADVGRLAVDPTSGTLYAVVYDFAAKASAVARLEGPDSPIATLTPGQGDVPAGVPQDVVWSAKRGRAYVALASYAAGSGGVVSWDGATTEVVAVEGQLAEAGTGEAGPFGATLLALSEDDDMLVVGGAMQSSFGGGIKGGGIAWVHLTDGGIAGLGGAKNALPGQHVAALAHDPVTGRTYAALRQPCNEAQLGNVGIIAISFRKDGSPRYERPILSGVRSLVEDGGEVWAALRDDNPGFACDGYEIRTGLVKLRSNRSGELVPLHTAKGDDIVPYPGATDLDLRAAGDLAVATWKAGIFWGAPAAGVAANQALSFGTSLLANDVEWLAPDRLWIAGEATHSQSDPPSLADKGPRGAALVTLDAEGLPKTSLHYVRASEDAGDVTGLPSANVMDVLVLADGSSVLACAAERYDVSWLDRIEGGIFVLQGVSREGGIARVAPDGTIEVLADSKAAPDPRALALAPDGSVLALDAQHGVLRLGGGLVEQTDLPFPLPDDQRAHDLWLGANGDVVASLWQGAEVSLGGTWQLFGDVGHAWQALGRADGVVLVGTDQGVLRVRAEGATDVDEPAIEPGLEPPYAPIAPPGGGGACLPVGTICKPADTCCDGMSCTGGIVLTCQ